jgi:hypothetical protein
VSKELREKLEESADNAAKHAVAAATRGADVQVMFLIDKSGSMEGAIENSKEALSRILAGFPLDQVHIATFDTIGMPLVPKAASRVAIQHMLAGVKAAGGTMHGAAVQALHQNGVRMGAETKLIVIVVGDEAGEGGDQLAKTFGRLGYHVSAMALLLSVAASAARGTTVRTCAAQLKVPFAEVTVESFNDPYQVPRVLQALLDAPIAAGGRGNAPAHGWVEKVMQTKLLAPPAR